jgi:hypothetical protein
MKKALWLIILLTLSTLVFSEETTATDSVTKTPTIQASNLFLQFGTVLNINTEDNSAPSPILYSLGAGYDIPITSWISFAPQGRFYVATYLWDEDLQMALPAEIENRTASVPSLLIDLPVNFKISKGQFEIGLEPGISFLLCYGITASGVEDVDDDIYNINTWFYSSAQFLYPSFRVYFDWTFLSGMKAGISLAQYFSIGSLINDTFPQEMKTAFSFRIFLPQHLIRVKK